MTQSAPPAVPCSSKEDRGTSMVLNGETKKQNDTTASTTALPNLDILDGGLSVLLDWSSQSLVPMDDGHCPEGLVVQSQLEGDSSISTQQPVPCQRVAYTAQATPAVYVTDQAVPPSLGQAWYDTMTGEKEGGAASWGTHVLMEEIYEQWQQEQQQGHGHDNTSPPPPCCLTYDTSNNVNDYRHGLAVAVAAAFVRQAWQIESGHVQPTMAYTIDKDSGKVISTINQSSSHSTTTCSPAAVLSAKDMPLWWQQRHAFGVAVWALCAPAGAAVPYHVDYAEQVRYATNIVAMPLQGGVLHCSPSSDNSDHDKKTMQGGDFYVYLHQSPDESIQHYEQHGYKSQRQALLQPLDQDPNCIVIPYRTNRLIHQAGYLPHGSTAVTDLGTAAGRVVVGLNVFGADVGQAVQAWPEHAPRFNAWVKQLRNERHKNNGNNNKEGSSSNHNSNQISLRALIQRHPDKARAWCRRQRKAQFQASVQQLELQIHQMLVAAEATNNNGRGVPMAQLQSTLARHDGTYPSPDDIWVFVSHRSTGPDALYRISNDQNGQEEGETLSKGDAANHLRVLLRQPLQNAE